jgi:hypothetical protein
MVKKINIDRARLILGGKLISRDGIGTAGDAPETGQDLQNSTVRFALRAGVGNGFVLTHGQYPPR